MDKLPEDIASYAKHPFIKFGDGYVAQVLSMRPTKSKDNQDVWDIIINPSNELIKTYNIRPGMPGVLARQDGTMIIRLTFPYDYLIHLNPDPSWNWWFCLQNYDGAINPAIAKVLPTNLLKDIEELKSKMETLKMQKAVAEENLNMMKENLPKYLKKNVMSIVEPAFEVAGKMIPNKPVMQGPQ